jgi:hypothetical protein
MWIRKSVAFFVIFSFVSLFFRLPPNDWLVDHVQYTMCSNDAHRKIMFRSCATIKNLYVQVLRMCSSYRVST